MKVLVFARLASLLLVAALLLPTLEAAATSRQANYGRHGRTGMHRPVYKKYQPGRRWIFQKF